MRSFWVLLLPFVVTGAYGQSDDSRLKAPVSMRERFMTLGELGDFVAAKSHLKVRVDKLIVERKVTIYCEDKPLGEIMERVATTLFLEWEPEDEGFHLKLAKDVEQGEKSLLALQTRLNREGVLKKVKQIANLATSTPEALKREAEELNNNLGTLSQDTTTAGKEKYREAADRSQLIQSMAYSRSLWDLAYALQQTTDRDVDRLLSGEVLIASTVPFPGLLSLKPEAAKTHDWMKPSKDNDIRALIGLQFDPDTGMLSQKGRTTTSGGGIGQSVAIDSTPLGEHPFFKRINDFRKADATKVFKAKLDRKADLPPGGCDEAWTLADHLLWLHDRTGVPIVAEGFRLQAGWRGEIYAPTIGDWANRIAGFDGNEPRVWWAMYRSEKSWLLVKDRYGWQHLAGEVPERWIRTMEAKAKTPEGLTIDDYADFVSRLNRVQEKAAGGRVAAFNLRPLFEAPLELRAWNALGPKSREHAFKRGVAVATLSHSAQQSLFALLQKKALFGLIDWDLVPCLLPGGPPAPPNLYIRLTDTRNPGGEIMGQHQYPTFMKMRTTGMDSHFLNDQIPIVGGRIALYMDDVMKWQTTIQLRDREPAPK